MTTAKEVLVSAFDKIKNVVAYNTAWEDGTGYLNHAVDDKTIEFDENGYAKSVSFQGRKIVLVKTNKGNVVLFERYTDPASEIVIGNMPTIIGQLFQWQWDGSLRDFDVEGIVGDPAYPSVRKNVGKRLETFSKM